MLPSRQTALDALDAGTPQSDTLYLFEDEGAFLQAVEPVKALAWCGRVTSADGSASWYVIAPGLQGQTSIALYALRALSPAPGRLHRRAVEPRRAG